MSEGTYLKCTILLCLVLISLWKKTFIPKRMMVNLRKDVERNYACRRSYHKKSTIEKKNITILSLCFVNFNNIVMSLIFLS